MTSEEWRELVRPDALGGTLEDILDYLAACEQARDGYAKDAYKCLARAEKAEAELSTLKARCEGMREALRDVLAERERQDAKWGEQDHDPFCYLTVLVEEVGEFAQAALHSRFGGEAAGKLRHEAVHVAAVALAIVECLDRAKWDWGSAVKTVALPVEGLGGTR